MNKHKLLKKALSGTRSLRFGEIVSLIEAFGFRLARISGSHYIFEHPALRELVNIQNLNGKAKAQGQLQLSRYSA